MASHRAAASAGPTRQRRRERGTAGVPVPGPARGASPIGRPTPGPRRPAHRAPSLSVNVPQMGIASALGLATIAAPLTGTMALSASKATTTTVVSASTGVSSSALVASAAFPLKTQVETSVSDTSLLPDDTPVSSVPSSLAAPRTVVVDKVSRSNERAVLPGCDGTVTTTDYENGYVPKSELCTLWDKKHQLRADAAVALAKLNIAYKKKFGHNLKLNSAYRTYAEQATLEVTRAGYAAAAGTSNHGWGLAVDIDGLSGYTAEYWWLRENAPKYGFDNPDWARPGGSLSEAWHWEYVDAVAEMDE